VRLQRCLHRKGIVTDLAVGSQVVGSDQVARIDLGLFDELVDLDRARGFAGIWTEFRGDRGTKSEPIPGPHLVYGFLTTSPNAIVEPIHPKATPVILTTEEERDVWMRAP